ncbi:MAG: replication initiation protein [bacterium]
MIGTDCYIKKHSHQELKKHVSIIHCSNSLSLLQRKISNILLFHAYPVLRAQEEHKIAIRELCNHLEYRGYNYDAIKQAIKTLISTVIEWNVFGDNTEEEDWTASSILASVNIKGAVCTYAYSHRMKQLLYSPTMYGKINLSIQSNFTSSYGLALYENCARYRNLPRTKVFPLDIFRKIMGVSNEKYLVFRDLKRRVINKAVEEVNTLSDLIVKPNINKVGQKIISIYFDISEKDKKNKLLLSGNVEKESPVICKLVEEHFINNANNADIIIEKLKNIYFLNSITIEVLIKKYGTRKIEEKLKQIESMPSFVDGKILNLAGFLIDALKKDYMILKSSRVLIEEKRISKEKEIQNAKRKEVEQDKIIREYEQYVDEQVSKFLNNIDHQNLNEIKAQFERYLLDTNNVSVLNKFKKSGFTNKIVRIFLRIFLEKLDLENGPKFITIEQLKNDKDKKKSGSQTTM